MVRKTFKSTAGSARIDALIKKYRIPREYLAINRRSVTRGIFIGLFWGFIPMPLQMLAVLATAPFVRFNVPIAISMVWLSNPLTMPLMYYMEYKTGAWLLGSTPLPDIELTLTWFQNHWDDILVPLYVGTIPYSTLVSALIAGAVNYLWIRSVKKARPHRFFGK